MINTDIKVKDKQSRLDYFNMKQVNKMRAKIRCFDQDLEKDERLNRCLCKTCYYINTDRWAGQAFTHSICEFCRTEMVFPTTDTDSYCSECAKRNELCKHCGATLD